jgi:hypothetical protein
LVKIDYKRQQAAQPGLIIQMYIQQRLGNFLHILESDDFNKEKATQHVKDVFAMSNKDLDQLCPSGAFNHVIRRPVAITDTALFEQPDNLEFSNLPLMCEGVFGDSYFLSILVLVWSLYKKLAKRKRNRLMI